MKTDEIPQEFQQVNRLFEQLAAAGDFTRIGEIYAEGARLLPPGAEMLTGTEAIRDFWTTAVSTMGVKSVALKTLELDIAGETAIEIGNVDLVAQHVESPARFKYVVAWKKSATGWRWEIDIWNAASS